MKRNLNKYSHHLDILKKRSTRRYKVSHHLKKPIEELSETEYSDGGYSTAEDLKDKEFLPHRYKLKKSKKRVPKVLPDSDSTIPDPDPNTIPKEVEKEPTPEIDMAELQQRIDQRAREMIDRGEYNHLFGNRNESDDDQQDQQHRHRHRRQSRQNQDDTSLRYSLRDIPTYDGKGDSMPHTHMIEFDDFLVNTGSKLRELPQNPLPHDEEYHKRVIRDVVSKFKASLKGKPRLWFEMQYPTIENEPKTKQEYEQMLTDFTTEHNPIGSTREQQIMAWKNLKWDPANEKLDDFVYRFRRVAKELGYNADENLETFNCCVPSHLYIYLRGATSIKEAMENIKRACALGGVSIKQNPTPTETTTGPVIPFMPMKDKQNLKTVKFQDEVFRDDQFNQIKEGFEHSALGMEEMVSSLDRLTQVIEKQYKDNRSRGRDRRNDRRNNRSRSNSYSSSRSRSRERSNSRDRNSRDRNRNQNNKEKRKNSGTRYSTNLYCNYCKMSRHDISHCWALQKDFKKLGLTVKKDEQKGKEEQERLQMLKDFKNYMDLNDPTN